MLSIQMCLNVSFLPNNLYCGIQDIAYSSVVILIQMLNVFMNKYLRKLHGCDSHISSGLCQLLLKTFDWLGDLNMS